MDVDSVQKLCQILIGFALQRCRMLGDLCMLSVSLKREPSSVRISVSDTGIGSNLEEFNDLKCQYDPTLALNWDGILCIATTSLSDKDIQRLKLDVKEFVSSRRVIRLQSSTKNGAKFSGTEVSLLVYEEIDRIVAALSVFLQKMLVMKFPNIAIELSVESGASSGSQFRSIISQNACKGNIKDNLKQGFEDYVSKHGNRLAEACQSCFSYGDNLKIGYGVASSRENQQNHGLIMEVAIIVSEVPEQTKSSCLRQHGSRTEVLYFRDFLPCSIQESSRDVLIGINWKKYGLTLKSVTEQDGVALLEWEYLPPRTHIDIVLHGHSKQVVPGSRSSPSNKSLARKAITVALKDLKENNPGILLSERAHRICNYAPDLAKTVSGLILSSHDLKFQEECFSLLGLHYEEATQKIEDCVRDKIVSAVAFNDKNICGKREAKTALFLDNAHVEEEQDMLPDEDYEDDEVPFR